jgi:hypothetical protein
MKGGKMDCDLTVKEQIEAAKQFSDSFLDYSIKNDLDNQLAADDLLLIKERVKALNDKRLELTRPLDESKKKIKALFDEPIDKLKKAEVTIKASIKKYLTARENERAKSKKKGEMELPTQKTKGVFSKEVWKYEIIDVNKIPRKYMIPNETLLGSIARGSKGTLKIAGVKFFKDKTIVAGGK